MSSILGGPGRIQASGTKESWTAAAVAVLPSLLETAVCFFTGAPVAAIEEIPARCWTGRLILARTPSSGLVATLTDFILAPAKGLAHRGILIWYNCATTKTTDISKKVIYKWTETKGQHRGLTVQDG